MCVALTVGILQQDVGTQRGAAGAAGVSGQPESLLGAADLSRFPVNSRVEPVTMQAQPHYASFPSGLAGAGPGQGCRGQGAAVGGWGMPAMESAGGIYYNAAVGVHEGLA